MPSLEYLAMSAPEQAALVQNAFAGRTILTDVLDFRHEPLYDTITVAANASFATGQEFFSSFSGKTLAQTNMRDNNKLLAPEIFAAWGIGIQVAGDILLADLVSLQKNFAVQFFIADKAYFTAPIEWAASGTGISGFATTTVAATSMTGYNLGSPNDRNNLRRLALPFGLDSGIRFGVRLVGTTFTTSAAGTGITIRCFLDGIHGVQVA